MEAWQLKEYRERLTQVIKKRIAPASAMVRFETYSRCNIPPAQIATGSSALVDQLRSGSSCFTSSISAHGFNRHDWMCFMALRMVK